MTDGGTPAASRPGLRKRTAGALKDAMRRGDRTAVSALRSALAAIGNAEAVDVPSHGGDADGSSGSAAASSEHVAGSLAGLGAAEVQRRVLDEAAVAAIVRHEVADRLAVAAELEGVDSEAHGERAGSLRAEAAVLRALLDTP